MVDIKKCHKKAGKLLDAAEDGQSVTQWRLEGFLKSVAAERDGEEGGSPGFARMNE